MRISTVPSRVYQKDKEIIKKRIEIARKRNGGKSPSEADIIHDLIHQKTNENVSEQVQQRFTHICYDIEEILMENEMSSQNRKNIIAQIGVFCNKIVLPQIEGSLPTVSTIEALTKVPKMAMGKVQLASAEANSELDALKGATPVKGGGKK